MRAERFPLGAGVTVGALEGDPHALLARLQDARAGVVAARRRRLAGDPPRPRARGDARRGDLHGRRPALHDRAGGGAEHALARRRRARPAPGAVRRAAAAGGGAAAAGRRGRRRRRRGWSTSSRRTARASCGAASRGRSRPRRSRTRSGSTARPGAVLGWYDAIVAAVTDLSAGRPAGPEAARAVAELGEAVQLGGTGLSDAEVTSNVAVLLFGGIETTEGMIANAVVHLLSDAGGAGRGARRPGAAARRGRGVAAARARRGGDRPLRDARHRARRRGDRRRRARADLDHRGQPRPGDVRRPRPLRPRAREHRPPPGVRGRPARVRRACTSRGSRRTSRSPRCSSACPACGSTGRPPTIRGLSSASRRSCACAGGLAERLGAEHDGAEHERHARRSRRPPGSAARRGCRSRARPRGPCRGRSASG